MKGGFAMATLALEAHAEVHGAAPPLVSMASTTDARIYLNQFGIPATCYGPRAHDIHGVDESVELDSIVQGARTLARFLAAWYAAPPTLPILEQADPLRSGGSV